MVLASYDSKLGLSSPREKCAADQYCKTKTTYCRKFPSSFSPGQNLISQKKLIIFPTCRGRLHPACSYVCLIKALVIYKRQKSRSTFSIMSVQIFQAAPGDVDKILPLYVGYRKFYKQEAKAEEAREFMLKRLQLNESIVFYAELDGKPVGFTQLYPLFCSVRMKRFWLLYDLFVDDSARRHGIGEKLLARADQLAKETGSSHLMLQTANDNKTAQSVYERHGYVRDDHFYVYDKNFDAPVEI